MDYRILLIHFAVAFTLILSVHLVINLWKVKKKKRKEVVGDSYVVIKFRLDRNKLNINKMIFSISLINSFIIAIVAVIISSIPIDLIWQLMIGIVMLFGLIYSIYELYGRYLVKKGYQKDENKFSHKRQRK